ncbi:MAG: POTRA domain-containing protein [Candidatus Acidiferrales bacterium]
MPHRPLVAKLALLVLIALLAPSFTCAQSSGSFNLVSIHTTGLARYTQDRVIRASGLRTGTIIAIADLQSASGRLANSGAFDSISYRYSTRGQDLTVEFTAVETKDALPCMFDNFVWFTDADLDNVLRQNVSFYDGKLPVRGESTAQARAALQNFLREKGLPGEVNFMPYAPLGGQVNSLLFRVDGAPMPIKSVAFSGERQVTSQQLSTAASGLLGQNFSSLDVAGYAKTGLLPLYHQRGYLRAAFGPPHVALVDPAAKGPSFDVAVTLTVKEGDQYSLSSINWSGNQAFSADELSKAVAMLPHEVANTEKIDAGFHNAGKLYSSRGYINAQIVRQPQLDDAAKLAAYAVQVKEGSQYHMGVITFDGVPERVAATLAKQWKLKPGDIYDADYMFDFLSKVALPELQRDGIKAPHPKLNQLPDPSGLLVNLRIEFQ